MTRKPVEAVHPSAFIKDEMDARGWTIGDVASRMPGDYGVNHLAIDMYLELGRDEPMLRIGKMSAELAQAFGVDADLFANLERAWLEHPATKAAIAKTFQ